MTIKKKRRKNEPTKGPSEKAVEAVNEANKREPVETVHPSTPQGGRPRKQNTSKVYVIDEIHDVETGLAKPILNTYIPRLARDYYQWANMDTSLVLRSFIMEKKICFDRFYAWMDKFPELRYAHEYARLAVGIRREEGSLKKKLEKDTVLKSMPMYDAEWKAIEKWRASLRIEESSVGGTKIVIMPEFKEEQSSENSEL
jgi:hypothetical protein